eukprot:Hpha_TRINITY_DN14535_c1_g1::TRINITY_DN14535_c1_g1_i2::g.46749::m.46749
MMYAQPLPVANGQGAVAYVTPCPPGGQSSSVRSPPPSGASFGGPVPQMHSNLRRPHTPLSAAAHSVDSGMSPDGASIGSSCGSGVGSGAGLGINQTPPGFSPHPPAAAPPVDPQPAAGAPTSGQMKRAPCPHNAWDNVRIKHGMSTLRCRICQCKWRLHFSQLTRCQDFRRGTCKNECPYVHVHQFKETLESRHERFGKAVLDRVPKDVADAVQTGQREVGELARQAAADRQGDGDYSSGSDAPPLLSDSSSEESSPVPQPVSSPPPQPPPPREDGDRNPRAKRQSRELHLCGGATRAVQTLSTGTQQQQNAQQQPHTTDPSTPRVDESQQSGGAFQARRSSDPGSATRPGPPGKRRGFSSAESQGSEPRSSPLVAGGGYGVGPDGRGRGMQRNGSHTRERSSSLGSNSTGGGSSAGSHHSHISRASHASATQQGGPALQATLFAPATVPTQQNPIIPQVAMAGALPIANGALAAGVYPQAQALLPTVDGTQDAFLQARVSGVGVDLASSHNSHSSQHSQLSQRSGQSGGTHQSVYSARSGTSQGSGVVMRVMQQAGSPQQIVYPTAYVAQAPGQQAFVAQPQMGVVLPTAMIAQPVVMAQQPGMQPQLVAQQFTSPMQQPPRRTTTMEQLQMDINRERELLQAQLQQAQMQQAQQVK